MKDILVIICDQLSATALSTYGNTYVNAPNIDSLTENGVVFENTYTTCPLCQPARASFWSSKYPHQTEILSNLPDQGFPTISTEIETLGDLFNNNGYECMHYGKTHDYGALRGFKVDKSVQIKSERENPAIEVNYETFFDEDTTRKVVKYLKEEVSEKPFLLVADLQNPHNICNYIGENEFGHKDFNIDKELPPLPDNFNFDDEKNRPEFIQYMCCAHRRQSQVVNWKEDDFRHYLYAYYHYIGIVDKQIGKILSALEESGKKDDTLIVFFADHGEGMAAHRLVTKYGAFYEETNRVPLIFSGNGVKGYRKINGLASLLDIMPTLADYAGISNLQGAEGISHYKQIIGESDKTNNSYVCGEWYDEYDGYIVPGRMFLDENYKYTVYKEDNSEELFDMKNDRGEKVNLASNKEYEKLLQEYREKLKTHIEKTDDNFYDLESCYNENYRKHELGLHNDSHLNATLEYAARLRKKNK